MVKVQIIFCYLDLIFRPWYEQICIWRLPVPYKYSWASWALVPCVPWDPWVQWAPWAPCAHLGSFIFAPPSPQALPQKKITSLVLAWDFIGFHRISWDFIGFGRFLGVFHRFLKVLPPSLLYAALTPRA